MLRSTLFFVLLLVHLTFPARAQIFLGTEVGTELYNDFKDLQHGDVQPYSVSARINAGVIVNNWRMGLSESFSYTNPHGTHLEGGFLQYGIELIEIDGAKLIDLYLGAEVYAQLIRKKEDTLPVGLLASTTLPAIVDLSIRAGYDVHLERYYLGLSLGRNLSKHTRPAGEKIPYPDNLTECQYSVFNQTQVQIQTLFYVNDFNPKDTVEERFEDLRHFTRLQNETAFIYQPSLEGAYAYLTSMGLSEIADAIRLGLERARMHQACKNDPFTPQTILPILWKRLTDSYELIRHARS